MTRPQLLVLALSSGLLAASVPVSAQSNTSEPGLHSLFVAAGKQYFGTATETNNFNDAPYLAILNDPNEFGQITPENSQKWEITQPRQGQFVFNNSDMVAAKAKTNKQILRCHTLTWHSQLPSFVTATSWTPSTLRAVLQTHLTNVITHFRGACSHWDVVNEALAETGEYRPSVFFNVLGESYIPLSFSIAASASANDPIKPKLYYNDYNTELFPQKTEGALRIVKLIQSSAASGARIDGVGFQSHLTVGKTPSQAALASTYQSFTALGVEVALTELDIAHPSLPATDADREQQAKDYVAVVGACLAVDKCVGVTLWQFTDKYSWIPGIFPGTGDACLWTADYKKKPAYFAVRQLLESAAGGAGTTTTTTGSGAAVTVSTASSLATNNKDATGLRFTTILFKVSVAVLFSMCVLIK